jgi:hypothetical protein
VAEGGWQRSVIDEVAAAARTAVEDALRSAVGAAGVGLLAAERRIPASLDQILGSHALLHAAEGQLFESAVIDAACDIGLAVHVVEPGSIRVPAAVDALGRSVGPPWQKDQKWATTAALTALWSGSSGR